MDLLSLFLALRSSHYLLTKIMIMDDKILVILNSYSFLDRVTTIDGHVYAYFRGPIKYDAAAAVCASCGCGAHLVVFDSTTEVAALQTWLNSINAADIFVGLRESPEYTWATGADYDPLIVQFDPNDPMLECARYRNSPVNQIGLQSSTCEASRAYLCESDGPCAAMTNP
ncbi:hypothetical protein B566_EDAN017526 [Ephemera danica]|nr:hypothetical protein B566_EDAN017526 [Ephemera danica]